jgi:hypothetical protein
MTAQPPVERLDFDLKSLRASLRPTFQQYDEAVAALNGKLAHDKKMAITNAAIDTLERKTGTRSRGLYFFVGPEDMLSDLTYIGLSKECFLNRMVPRLRDETCVDETQYRKSREDIWDTAYRRMCVSMRGTAPETRIRHAFDHVKTTKLFDGADRIIFFKTDAAAEEIQSAEAILIFSAVSANAPLLNIQERQKVKANLHVGRSLAFDVIDSAGIDTEHWRAKAQIIFDRFGGACCS